MNLFADIIQSNRAWLCLDCGKCSSVCPVTIHLVDGYTSPRLLIENAIATDQDTILDDPLLWSCLTCNRCTEICPSIVEFSNFIQNARQIAREKGLSGDCTHSGMIQTWIRMMAEPDIEQNRLEWISDDLKISQDSDTIYFPGCLPYYDAAFAGIGIRGNEIAQSAVKILNHLGVEPQILENERCCGHDQYWQGDMDTFNKLAALNLELFESSGAKRIVTTCPECAHTLKHIYPEQLGGNGLEVKHLTEFLFDEGLSDLVYPESDPESPLATYQDPCRLGRFSGIYQEPRSLIQQLGFNLVEMDHNQKSSLCCGTSCWSTCGQVNKRIQVDRLQEAISTGAEVLITACLKCQIHFKCAQNDPLLKEEIQIPIQDLTTMIAKSL